jgi:hypothetical protein
MQRHQTNQWLPATFIIAAAAVTIAFGGFLDALFAPAPTAIGAQAIAKQHARPATEVAIVPARIEVAGVRAPEFAGSDGAIPAIAPRS